MLELAIKSITQRYNPNVEQMQMMNTFKDMVNHCIGIGLKNNCSTMKKLSLLSYAELKEYPMMSYYKLTAIAQAAGRLAQMKHDIRKGKKVKSPFVRKPYLVSCYEFKINGMLLSFPIQNRKLVNILLNDYVIRQLSNKTELRSFTITPNSLSFTIRKYIEEIKPENVIGIDRNLRNVTISTRENCIMYRTEKILSIKENTMRALTAFRRNDRRMKIKFFSQKRHRQTRRVNQYLHKVSKDIVQKAKESKSMIVFEELKGIRKLYRRGNGQGNEYRRKLNSWSFHELQRQIQYKAAWEGIPIGFIDPKCTSKMCPICGDRIQEDNQNLRKTWCGNCMMLMDRDVIASMNIAYKGWTRLIHPRGLSGETMKRNVVLDKYQEPLILRVDGSKLVEVNIRNQQSLLI